MPRYVRNMGPLSNFEIRSSSRRSSAGASQEVPFKLKLKLKLKLRLSDPEMEPHAACEARGTGMIVLLAAEDIPSNCS